MYLVAVMEKTICLISRDYKHEHANTQMVSDTNIAAKVYQFASDAELTDTLVVFQTSKGDISLAIYTLYENKIQSYQVVPLDYEIKGYDTPFGQIDAFDSTDFISYFTAIYTGEDDYVTISLVT
jgi:hypothetical protein